MRKPRLLAPEGVVGVYHVTSRVVDRRRIFGEAERKRFLWLAKALAAFGGIELISWCLMGNHFHLLVRVDPEGSKNLSDEEVLARAARIYTPEKVDRLREQVAACLTEESRASLLDPLRQRMGDLASYVGLLKQMFTQWYNARKGREGTLWQSRYHSVLLDVVREPDLLEEQGLGPVARVVAAYIDLNPVRAKQTDKPEDCLWSGYARAVRFGDEVALEGVRWLWGRARSPEECLELHGQMVRGEGSRQRVPEEGPRSGRGWVKEEESAAVPRERREDWSKVRTLGRADIGLAALDTMAED